MISLPNSLEELVSLRDQLLKTIVNLEMGLFLEKKKVDEFEFYLNDKQFDQCAIESQLERSKLNIIAINNVLNTEKDNLKLVNEQIDQSNKIINCHKLFPCLINYTYHDWIVLSRHPSGQFSYRKCSICGTTEKVGVV